MKVYIKLFVFQLQTLAQFNFAFTNVLLNYFFVSPPATLFSIQVEENLFLLLITRSILKLLFAGAVRG